MVFAQDPKGKEKGKETLCVSCPACYLRLTHQLLSPHRWPVTCSYHEFAWRKFCLRTCSVHWTAPSIVFFHLCAGIPLSCFPINNWAFSLPKLSKWRRDKGLGWKSLARFSLTAAFLLQLTFAQTNQATDTTPTSLLPTSWDRRPGLSPLCPQGIEPSLQGHSTLVLGDTESVTMGRLRLNIFWLQVRHPAPEIWETWHLSQARKRARDSCQPFSPTGAMRSYLGANPFLSSKAVTSSPFSKTNTWLFDESLVPWHL